jgi:hypothetical protein
MFHVLTLAECPDSLTETQIQANKEGENLKQKLKYLQLEST